MVTQQPSARPGGLNELGGEPLYPPVDRDVINADATFSQQLLNVTGGQAVTQLPAHRDCDHLAWEMETGEGGGAASRQRISRPDATIGLRNGAANAAPTTSAPTANSRHGGALGPLGLVWLDGHATYVCTWCENAPVPLQPVD